MIKSIGFIPLRKNSKGIPYKNKRKMVGRPLFTWVLCEAVFSNLDEVYIYTDDDEVIEFVEQEYSKITKVRVLKRSEESATDTASTEFAILEFCDKINYDFNVFCLLQATSPFTTSQDINTCLERLIKGRVDSVLTVANAHKFIWSQEGKSINYNPFKRPRRQDFQGVLIENGAIYSTTKEALQTTKNRLGNTVVTVNMPEESLVEIDSETDWVIVEQLLIDRQKRQKESKKITHLILDVDGVFTAGTITYSKEGEFSKEFDMRDGMGLELLRTYGIHIIVITSENSSLVGKRMKKLKIDDIFLGVKDKYTLLKSIVKEKQISFGSIAYVGDDINDLTNICSVGWSFAPNNAMSIVKQHADIVLHKNSSQGAIREACEFIITYNKRF